MTKKVDNATAGQPSKYKKTYCALVLKLMKEGQSILHVANEIGVVRSTIQNWSEKHPEFLVALEKGQQLAEAFWMNQGESGLWNQGQGITFNSTVWKYFMANRFNWKDKQEVENTGEVPITKVQIEGLNGPTSNDKSN